MRDQSSSVERTAAALADVLIPADSDAGGLSSGAARYILARMASGDEPWLTEAGLLRLDAEADARFTGAAFSELTPQDRAAVIAELETGNSRTEWPPDLGSSQFVKRLIVLTHEGFYGDPDNGGNDRAASWRMLGYSSGIPGRP